MPPAKINYAILSSHRSGSSLLCTLLTQTGIAGKPGEYFSHWQGRSHNNYDISDYLGYIRHIVDEMQTANGVFRMKMMTGEDGFHGILNKMETFPTILLCQTAKKFVHFSQSDEWQELFRIELQADWQIKRWVIHG